MHTEEQLRKRIAELEAEVITLKARLRRRMPDIRALLSHRGFHIHRSSSTHQNLLLPLEPRYRGPYLRLFSRYSFRLFLRDVIRHYDGIPEYRTTRFITGDVYTGYLDHLRRWGLVRPTSDGYFLTSPVRSFGPTLEWWIAHILKSRLGFPCLRQVFFRGLPVGGDFDLIAAVEGRIAYVEVKSSPPKQIHDREMEAFLRRMNALSPSMTVLLVDTELRMKDKLVPMMETALARIGVNVTNLSRLQSELFHHDHRLYLVNAKGGVQQNLEKVVADHLLHRSEDV